ncbi:MAG: BppU family phage baseplate upper protein [Clostridiales bacterium]|nr:BppU family phage baseplate upper protein [Clostridiales bacterium]
MQNYQSITLDVNNCVEYKYINAKQGDIDSRFLRITLIENGEKIEPTNRCTASFRCLKPDGRICMNKSTINEDGTITAALTEQVLASAGTVRADVSLLDGSTVLSSATFFIIVEAAPVSEGSALSSDEFLILVKATNDAISAIHSIEDALGEVEEVKAFVGYNDSDILGLQIDYENKKFNRLAGAVGLNAGDDFDKFDMYGGMKRCNVSDGGTITAYYGDSNFKEDGSNGQVMVYVPKFYYKVVPIKLDKINEGTGYHIRKANYYISSAPKVGFKLHPAFVNEQGNEVEYFLYSAYEGSLYMSDAEEYYSDADYQTHTVTSADKLSSVAEKKPITGQATANYGNGINLYRSTAETCAANRGKGWHIETIKSLSALQLLMTIEFGAMHMQEALGRGICASGNDWSLNFCADTGATSSLGNKSGEAVSTVYRYHDKSTNTIIKEEKNAVNANAVSYRGIENPYGNVFNWIQGINCHKTDLSNNGGLVYICNDFNFADDKSNDNYLPIGFTIINSENLKGSISAFGYDEKYDWIFCATEVNGTTALPVGDPAYRSNKLNDYAIMCSSGGWYSGNSAGPFNTTLNVYSTSTFCQTGCRLIYLPQN